MHYWDFHPALESCRKQGGMAFFRKKNVISLWGGRLLFCNILVFVFYSNCKTCKTQQVLLFAYSNFFYFLPKKNSIQKLESIPCPETTHDAKTLTPLRAAESLVARSRHMCGRSQWSGSPTVYSSNPFKTIFPYKSSHSNPLFQFFESWRTPNFQQNSKLFFKLVYFSKTLIFL